MEYQEWKDCYLTILSVETCASYTEWHIHSGIYRLGRYFGLTCHPQATGRISRLDMLEKFLTDMEQKGDIWFATGREVANWTRKKLG